MDKISSGQIKMKPKAYYVSIGFLTLIATILLSFVTLYLVSVWSFWLRVNLSSGPAFGARRNLAGLVSTFPWWALILGILALAALVYTIKKTGHLYKIRLRHLVPIMLAIFIFIGFILSYSGLPGLINGHNPVEDGGFRNGRGRIMK